MNVFQKIQQLAKDKNEKHLDGLRPETIKHLESPEFANKIADKIHVNKGVRRLVITNAELPTLGDCDYQREALIVLQVLKDVGFDNAYLNPEDSYIGWSITFVVGD